MINQMSIYKTKLQLAFVTLGRRLFNISSCYLILSRRLLSEISFNGSTLKHSRALLCYNQAPKNPKCQTLLVRKLSNPFGAYSWPQNAVQKMVECTSCPLGRITMRLGRQTTLFSILTQCEPVLVKISTNTGSHLTKIYVALHISTKLTPIYQMVGIFSRKLGSNVLVRQPCMQVRYFKRIGTRPCQ